MSNFGLIFTLNDPGFEPDCPYFQGHQNSLRNVNIFRVKDSVHNHRMFTADSFGNHKYIDIARVRRCSTKCGCHLLSKYQESQVYTFVAHVNSDSLRVQVHSPELRVFLRSILYPQQSNDENPEMDTFDGLVLLRNREPLKSVMEYLPHSNAINVTEGTIISEARLLISGLLGDPDFLSCFAPEIISPQAYLSHDEMQTYYDSQLDWDLGYLEDSVDTPEALELAGPEQQPRSNSRATTETTPHFEYANLTELRNTERMGQTEQCLIIWGGPTTTYSISSKLATLGSPKFRSRLEYHSGCPENSLINAARNGDLPQVKQLFELASELKDQSMDPTLPLIDIDAVKTCEHHGPPIPGQGRFGKVVSQVTALMAAVEGQHYDIARFLIEQGADVNVITRSGTALSIAYNDGSRYGSRVSHRIGQILLRSGADPLVALLLARQQGDDPKVLNDLVKSQGAYNCDAARHPKALLWGGLRARQMLRQVHENFIAEHTSILQAGVVQAGLHSKHWLVGIENNWKKAWKTGIRSLRQLCSGNPPATLNEVLMFLGVSRSMANWMGVWDQDYQENFVRDVGRWQSAFNHRTWTDFRSAVYDIWGISLDSSGWLSMADLKVMSTLRDAVTELVHRASGIIGSEHAVEGSFSVTRQEWKNNAEYFDFMDQHMGTEMPISPSAAGHDNDHFVYFDTSPLISHNNLTKPPQPRKETKAPRAPNISSLDSSPSNLTLTTFLMAGTIFATVVSFLLLALRYTTQGSSVSRSQLYKPIAKHILAHILSAVAVSMQVDPSVFSEVEAIALSDIQNGEIVSYTQLGEVLASQDIFKVTPYAQQLRSILDIWHSTFLAQETYTLVSQYLGSMAYTPITSDAPFPNQEFPNLHAINQHIPELDIPEPDIPETDMTMDIDDSPTPSPPLLPVSTPALTSNPTPSSTHSLQTPPPQSSNPARAYCADCHRDFGKVYRYNRHRRDIHDRLRFTCRVGCGKNYSRNDTRATHERTCRVRVS
ncbi:hypothetical protein FQN55_006168 [Onygenales sp. PD_40]|nr:hypothetical protein FQN55_006168 [Onygenales sp. PD_40]KAK2770295.1 hypothetical protein FQN53_005644 [Emmonsiellopsis sp. PD_33]